MYTREAFDQQRALATRVEHRDTRLLAVVSIGLGVGQLLFIRWIEMRLPRKPAVTLEGAVFLAYAALVCWLLWRRQRHLRAVRLRCPQCGRPLEGLSERVAAATGRCDACGGQVLEPGA
jgi:hypothetical protein